MERHRHLRLTPGAKRDAPDVEGGASECSGGNRSVPLYALLKQVKKNKNTIRLQFWHEVILLCKHFEKHIICGFRMGYH